MSSEERPKSPAKSSSPPPDLRKERDEFLQQFSKGGRLTEEFITEFTRLSDRLNQLEIENTQLRAEVKTESAIRELLAKIEQLEREKSELLSRTRLAEAASNRFSERFEEIESEFANLANLFVASNQIHSSLSPRGVVRRIKEVLAQLVGAESYCIYLASRDRNELVPIASEGVRGSELAAVAADQGLLGEVFSTGEVRIDEERDSTHGDAERPAAALPLTVDDQVVGVIGIFSTLSQKRAFDTIDFELFKLLGQHAAAALISATLFTQAERRMPGLEAFLDLSV